MRTRVIRFTCKLVFISAILFSGGSVLFTEYTDSITTPTSSYATLSKLPIFTELQNYYDSAVFLKQQHENASNSDVSGTSQISSSTTENTKCEIHDLAPSDTTIADISTGSVENDELASYLTQEQEIIAELAAEQSSYDMDTTETPLEENIVQAEDTNKTDTPEEQVLTRIQTKIKYVETILRKAVIKPYQINGQIQGLQLNGLEKILVARDLLLKSGDIILSVNGHALSSKKRAYQVFKKARKLPMMEIELLRDGKSTTLLYCLK